VVLDERVLEIPAAAPPGEYTLVAGLYDVGQNQRLALPDGTTAVLVTSLIIQEP
jgi:hypothetical protein